MTYSAATPAEVRALIRTGPAHGPHHRLLRWLRSGKSGGAA